MRGDFDEDELDDEGPFEFAEGLPVEADDFDCGMNIQGDCGKTGSEECDWECPYRDLKRN